MELTVLKIEEVVLANDNPERMFVDYDDWREIRKAVGVHNTDEYGVFVKALNTKIYSVRPVTVSLAGQRTFKDILAAPEEIR